MSATVCGENHNSFELGRGCRKVNRMHFRRNIRKTRVNRREALLEKFEKKVRPVTQKVQLIHERAKTLESTFRSKLSTPGQGSSA